MTALQTKTRLAVRMAYFFDVFVIVAIPYIISIFFRNKASKVYIYLTLYIMGFSYYIYVMVNGARGCVPYSFFWQ